MNNDNCTFPACPQYKKPGSQYCYDHGRLMGVKPAVATKPYQIPKESTKMKKIKRTLKQRYEEYLSRPENKKCRIQFKGCTGEATVVNHTNGRGENVLNEADWEPSCTHCNDQIEKDHYQAAVAGHKKQRHHKDNLRGKLKKDAA